MVTTPRAILIDLDGTLCDTDASVQAGIDGACAEAQRMLGIDELVWRKANSDAARVEWSSNARRWMDGTLSPRDLSMQIYARTLTAAGADPALAQVFVDAHAVAATAGLHTYPDVQPFLLAASRAGIKLALITNGASDTQRAKIETLGIASHFESIVVSSEHGVSKPDPEIFEIALSSLGIDASNAWHVGDSLESDVAGAIRAGLHAVWLNRDPKPRRADEAQPFVEVALLNELVEHFSADA